jgi:hypothetical protein
MTQRGEAVGVTAQSIGEPGTTHYVLSTLEVVVFEESSIITKFKVNLK